ncbi:hypothetical protein LCGC14_2324180 [marine sediment metagenome]|uniref:Roc domain-containing protein n=1 Tax=marine sediment metagenome TaxID=412755 RepID=A0A0F9D4H4_9ZZZZ
MDNQDDNPHYIFKICLIGTGGVGKTCIARRLCFNTFKMDTQSTIGIDFYTYNLPLLVDNEKTFVNISIWDFGGQEQFKKLFSYYIGGVNGVFLVFDLTNMQSLIMLNWWYDKLLEYNVQDCPKFLIGTKLDLLENVPSKVDELIVEEFLNEHNEKDYFKTSSKDNTHILESFKEIVKKILDSHNLNYDKFF